MSSNPSPRARESVRSAPSLNIERKRHSDNIPSRIVPQENNSRKCTTPNPDIKSKYCVEEMKKSEYSRSVKRNDSAPAKRRETKCFIPSVEESRQRDMIFLRKMLAINKKQEMMLNKRLAKLLEEEEASIFSDETEKNYQVVEKSPSSQGLIAEKCAKFLASPNAKHVSKDLAGVNPEIVPKDSASTRSDNIIATKPSQEPFLIKAREVDTKKPLKPTSVKKIQYDINGRRIFYYNDLEKESAEEEREQIQELNNKKNEKIVNNSTKLNKKGSANSKKTFTMKKSLTYINKEGRILKKSMNKGIRKEGRVRKENGDSPDCGNSESPLEFALRPKKVDSQGDGIEVQNVVVHCSTVISSNPSSKKNLKVWNYKSLHSLESDNSIEKNRKIISDQMLLNVGDSNKKGHDIPVSVRNNNIQIQLQKPQTRKCERSSKTVETLFLLHNKYNPVDN